MSRIIKVAVHLTVEVDEDEWCLNYGPAVPVRGDVRRYVADAALYSTEAIKAVTIR